MHKAQRGHKLSVVRKVVTPLNFVTLPSFSVTLPSCDPPEPYLRAQFCRKIYLNFT